MNINSRLQSNNVKDKVKQKKRNYFRKLLLCAVDYSLTMTTCAAKSAGIILHTIAQFLLWIDRTIWND